MNKSERSKRNSLYGWLPGLILCSLVLAFEPAAPAHADTLSTTSAINKAGRQRMLSQRIVKAYCQIGLGVVTGKSKSILESSTNLFDTQLTELKQLSDKPGIKEAIAKEEQLWLQLKSITSEPVSMEGAKKLLGLNEELLLAADLLTKLIENTSNTKSGHLVNLAGRQRMLSQRIAKFYMLSMWGFKQPEIAKSMEQAKMEFLNAMLELESAPQNTPQIRQTLAQARIQWEHFLVALEEHQSNGTNTGSAIVAALASEHVLEIMDKVTGLYESEAAGS